LYQFTRRAIKLTVVIIGDFESIIQQRPSGEANSCPADQEITSDLWTENLHNRVNKNPQIGLNPEPDESSPYLPSQ
jgi:hypothetical protein